MPSLTSPDPRRELALALAASGLLALGLELASRPPGEAGDWRKAAPLPSYQLRPGQLGSTLAGPYRAAWAAVDELGFLAAEAGAWPPPAALRAEFLAPFDAPGSTWTAWPRADGAGYLGQLGPSGPALWLDLREHAAAEVLRAGAPPDPRHRELEPGRWLHVEVWVREGAAGARPPVQPAVEGWREVLP